jgi:hypothetical protein
MTHWVMTSDRNDDCNGLVIINYIIIAIRATSPEFHPEGTYDPNEIQLQEEDPEGIIKYILPLTAQIRLTIMQIVK